MNDPEQPQRPFPVGGPTTTTWREHALARARELRSITDAIHVTSNGRPAVEAAVDSIYAHLAAVKDAAEDRERLRWYSRAKVSIGGASVERALSNLDSAEYEILSLADLDYVRGQLPNLLAHVRGHLPADDARRLEVEALARNATKETFGEVERGAVAGAVRMASVESRREVTRVRSFRNTLWIAAGLLTLVVLVLVTIGVVEPQALPMCFSPDNEVVCPTSVEKVPGVETGQQASVGDVDPVIRETASPWDIPVVAFIGLIAAAVAAAASLRDVKGSSTPYSLPTALAVLKLPTGALTAFLGLQLMRGEFVPGLSALDSPAQILAWAILFGYAQQLLTKFVDEQAQGVLDEVGKADQPAANSTQSAAATPPQPSPAAGVAPQP